MLQFFFSKFLVRAYLSVCFLLLSFSSNAQEYLSYHLEIAPEVDLGTIQQTVNPDNTITITTNDADFSAFINSQSVYAFEKSFPTAKTPRLQRVYTIKLDSNQLINNFLAREEILNMEIIYEPELATDMPNDYIYAGTGERNTVLDLIRAPLAWSITQGDPNILVGVVDLSFEETHEDFQGQIFLNLDDSPTIHPHGTQVAGNVAAKTNNGVGIASVGYNTRLVTADNYGTARVLEVSQIPGVKVINCSWAGCYSNSIEEAVYQEIADSGVLVVAAAGNGNGMYPCNGDYHAYRYPASYPTVLSVTSVGHKFPIGNFDSVYGATAWEDCHQNTPSMNPQNTHTHNDKVDICAPGWHINLLLNNNSYSNGIGSGTSQSAPIVAGVAALVFAVNPNLTAYEVKDIIKNTADDIYYIPYNQAFIGQLGTGRVNAFRAVLMAKCMLDPTPGLDLITRNSLDDVGAEPDTNTEEVFWDSKDIWIRNQNDGHIMRAHQNPVYDGSGFNYAYVRVINKSCEVSSGNDQLKLYWAKANTDLSWPNPWDGSETVGNNIPLGGEVGTVNIPALGPGEEAILEFEWEVPNPQDYAGLNPNIWHFCLLSRIVSADDPMTFAEATGVPITSNVVNNNNIAWKNLSIIEINADKPSISGAVAVGGLNGSQSPTKLEFSPRKGQGGKPLFEEAEISVEMNADFLNAWDRGGKQGTNFRPTGDNNKIIVSGEKMVLDNLEFLPGEYPIINLSFNFLTEEITDRSEYVYNVIQKDANTEEIIGGEVYQIRKTTREVFYADAGSDQTVEKNQTVNLTAGTINEDVIYNWYSSNGELLYTGNTLTVSPEITEKYKLEVISNLDGLKDYDEMEVKVKPYYIENLSPNPAAGEVLVNYNADGANSAYLMIVSIATGSADNYLVDTNSSSQILDVTNYPTGYYSVVLVCEGEIQSVVNLIKM